MINFACGDRLKSSHFVLPSLLHAEGWTVVFGDGVLWVVVGGARSGGHYLETQLHQCRVKFIYFVPT